MKRKILSTFLCLCMVLTLLPITASAVEHSGSCGDSATWTYDDDTKILTISGEGTINFTGASYAWSELESIEFNGNFTAFESCWGFSNLKSLTIPDGVTDLGDRPFWNCPNLSHIVIPASVTNIAGYPYSRDCPLTTAGPIGSGCDIEFGWTEAIPANAFYGFKNLTSVTWPDGVQRIGENAFKSTGLTNINIPDSVKFVGSYAFTECEGLTQVSIPASVLRLGSSAGNEYTVFFRCKNLSEILVDPSNVEYSSQDGALFSKEKLRLIWCPPAKTEYIIPDGVTDIGDRAFYAGMASDQMTTSQLENVTIPDSVTSIGGAAFASCSGLTDVVIPASVTSVGWSAFENCTGLVNAALYGGSWTLRGTFDGCSNLKTVNIAGDVERLDAPFVGCANLTEVSLPAALTRIGANTFANCLKLQKITYAGTETQWGQIKIESGNQEISQATLVCTGTDTPETPDTPDTPETPDTPDTPDIPDTPDMPGTLDTTSVNGGLGKCLTVQVQSGHWLTIQTRRAGSISLTSIQADGNGTVSIIFSVPIGSALQLWETEEEMTFTNGIPDNPILKTFAQEI